MGTQQQQQQQQQAQQQMLPQGSLMPATGVPPHAPSLPALPPCLRACPAAQPALPPCPHCLSALACSTLLWTLWGGEVLARSSSASTPGTTRFTRSKWSILAWWVLALALVLALVLVLQLWCASAHACMCVCRPIQPGCWTSCWLLPLKGPC